MAVVNSGTISALTSSAFVIEDTNAAGGEIDVDVSNSGSITAATSQAFDFSALDGGRLDFNNSGSACRPMPAAIIMQFNGEGLKVSSF